MTPTRGFVLLLLGLTACGPESAPPAVPGPPGVQPAGSGGGTAGTKAPTGGATATGGAIAPVAGTAGGAGAAGATSAGAPGGGVGGGVATAGASGAGGTGAGRTYAPTFSAIYSEIFLNSAYNCNLGACHVGSSMMVGADAATTYRSIIDVAASKVADTNLPDTCGTSGMKLIVPNKPDESLLLLKVKDAPPCGARMRIGGPFLDDREIDQITKWIQMGALNN